jgi:hypothetical protein
MIATRGGGDGWLRDVRKCGRWGDGDGRWVKELRCTAGDTGRNRVIDDGLGGVGLWGGLRYSRAAAAARGCTSDLPELANETLQSLVLLVPLLW